MDIHWPRKSILPFLVLAYPFTYFVFQGGQYCRPLCFEPTLLAVVELSGGLIVLGLIAWSLVNVYEFDERKTTRRVVRWLVSPPTLAGIVLLGLFAGFIGFLTLDALSLYEAIWKPIILPLSFLLFLPVWMLYMASFPLAVLLSAVGIETSPVITLVFRGVVIGVGFSFSAVVQTIIASAVVDRVQTD